MQNKKPGLIVCMFVLLVSQLQAQDWIQRQGGFGNDETTDIAARGSNFICGTGYFSGTADFSATNSLSSSGLTDVFVVSYSQDASVQWSVKAGGSASDRGLSVDADDQGNIYVTGFYNGQAQFEGTVVNAVSGGQDIFLAKYNSFGDLQWVRTAGGSQNSDVGDAVAVGNDGKVLISGQFTGTASFGAVTINAQGSNNNGFVAAYSPGGNVLWARALQSDATSRALSCDFDAMGNAVVTGQVTGDLTLDNSYSNNSQNAIFLAKLDDAGNETWVQLAVGGGLGIAYDVQIGAGGSVYIAGGFENEMSFLGPPQQTVSGNYTNAAFVARYTSDGSLQWAQPLTSQSAVMARGLTLSADEVTIIGEFECVYTELADDYGGGIFNSMGYEDVFIAGFSTSGDFQYARQVGGQQEDVSADIVVANGELSYSGTFRDHLVVPSINNVDGNEVNTLDNDGPNGGATYCGDPHYGEFSSIESSGATEGFIVNGLNLDREPLDYWARNGTGCDRSRPDFCIYQGSQDNVCGPDTIEACNNITIGAVSLTASNAPNIGQVGPNWNYQWSNGETSRSITVSSEGTYSVELTSADGCISGSAAVYVEFLPIPENPWISDDQGINEEANPTQPIVVCAPADIELTAGNYNGNIYEWFGPDLSGVEQQTIPAEESGTYTFSVTNEEGCTNSVSVGVVIQEPEPPEPIDPALIFQSQTIDSLAVCGGSGVNIQAIDLLTAPEPLQNAQVNWIFDTPTVNGSQSSFMLNLLASQEGWYTTTANITLLPGNDCGGDTLTYQVTDSVYVSILPTPTASVEITTETHIICPGDSLVLNVTASDSVDWSLGSQVLGTFESSITVTESGTYTVSVATTNEAGCTASATDQITLENPEVPSIISNPEEPIICPNDSVLLQSSPGLSYSWVGPNGAISDTSHQIYVMQAGEYFCEVEVGVGCTLVTNTIEVTQYSTPQITTDGPPVLCPGESITISTSASNNAQIEWQSPLSGNSPEQVVDDPGTYTALVTACNITTQATIEVDLSGISLELETVGPAEPCVYDSLLLVASGVSDTLLWQPGAVLTDSLWVFDDGTYTVTASDTNGCTLESEPLNVQFQDSVVASPIEELVCRGNAFQYSPDQGQSLMWFSDSSLTDTITTGNLQTVPLFTDSTYYFELAVNGCLSQPARADITVQAPPDAPVLESNAPVCLNELLTLSAQADIATSYSWTLPGGGLLNTQDLSFVATDTATYQGEYDCVAAISGCSGDTSSISVNLYVPRQVQLPPDTTICDVDVLELSVADDFSLVVWNAADTTASYLVEETGTVTVMAKDVNGCETSDSGYFKLLDCHVDVPNIITPNGDDRNDGLLIKADAAKYLELQIFNRWGRLIYRSKAVPAFWDGRNMRNDRLVSEGTYFYILSGLRFDGMPINDHGDLTVIRQ